jgi:conjugal transfer pilus assembly protein TraK
MSFRREIVVEGEGLAVREYLVSLKDGFGKTRLSEREFLRFELTSRPLAVAVEELLLQERTQSRVFIVERRDTDAPSPFVRQQPVKADPATDSTPLFPAEEDMDVF